MKIPRTKHIRQVLDFCCDVDCMTDVLVNDGKLARNQWKMLATKTIERMVTRYDAVRGNRNESLPMTFADLRLLMSGCLRDALKTLEETPPDHAA